MIRHVYTRRTLRLAGILGIIGFLTACVTPSGGPRALPSQPAVGGLYGLERGSGLEAAMGGDDRQALAAAASELLASGEMDVQRTWVSRSGTSGDVRLGGPYLIGLDATAGAPVPAPAGIDTSVALEPSNGNYTALKNANVRLGPSTSAPISLTLAEGTTVRAYGHVPAKNWYLVGVSDAVVGYVFGDLLEPAGGGAPILAGGGAKRPRLCRNLAFTMRTMDGRSDAWSSLVCQRADGGWEVPSERGLM